MNKAFVAAALFSLFIFSGCSETLPLGAATKYPHYSNAVIVGAVARDPLTGRYAALNQGGPLSVTTYNGVEESLSETIEEDQLELLIALQARRMARRLEIKEEMAQIVVDRSQKQVILNPDLATRPYMGTTHGIPQ